MMQLGNVMSKNVITTTDTKTVRDVARMMSKHNIGSLVVGRRGKIVGIVTERDVLRAVAKGLDPEDVTVGDIMSRPVVVADESTDLRSAIKLMVHHNIKKLPVMRDKELVGIVTLTDFARFEPLVHDLLEQALAAEGPDNRKKFERLLAPSEPGTGMYQ